MEKDEQFVAEVVRLLVDHPESVAINRTIDDLGVLITLRVHPEDMATIIGREGRSAKAIRTLLRIIGAKEDQRVNLKIVEPEGQAEPADASVADAPVTPAPAPEPTPEPLPPASQPAAEEKPSASSFMDDIPEPLA